MTWTIDDDLRFWRQQQAETKNPGYALVVAGIVASLSMAKSDHTKEVRHDDAHT